jgi:hypothetical protein
MIHNMASLKEAMGQMDADDIEASQAAKDRAAQILADSRLSFSKLAELIEQRRLLLRPKIIASIKRMDQPEMLGDAAFRDAGTSLRREGQSFRQIAEALELNGGTGTRHEDTVLPKGELLHQLEMDGEPRVPAWLRALAFGTRIFFYPLRHPIRSFIIAVIAFMLVNTFRGFVGVGRQVSGYVADVSAARQRADAAMSSVSSFVEKHIKGPSQDTAPTPPAPIPSPSSADAPTSATPSPGPTAASAPPASEAATPATPPTTNAAAPASTPRPDARSGAPSTSTANGQLRTVGPRRAFDDLMPAQLRRNSRSSGPCIAGAGGCYWGGTRY